MTGRRDTERARLTRLTLGMVAIVVIPWLLVAVAHLTRAH